MVNQQDDFQLLRLVAHNMDRRRQANCDRLRQAVKAAAVPLPQEIVHDLSRLSATDVREVLREHPGFHAWELRASYQDSFQIFETSFRDLFSAIDRFDLLAKDGNIFNRAQARSLREMECVVRKELFSALNALHSLVDHTTRRLQDSLQIPDFHKRRLESFGDDGLHEFLVGLRTLIHHIQIVRPSLQAQFDLRDRSHSAAFALKRDDLSSLVRREKGKMAAPGQHYLEKAPAKLDIRPLFIDYQRRAEQFHSWFKQAIALRPPAAWTDYQRCLSEHDHHAARIWWRVMLRNWLRWQSPPNPYHHLDRFLTHDELSEVLKLPVGSAAQVDKILEYVDADGACDDELRQMAYELFRRAAD